MFGFIHESVRVLIVRTYGEEMWMNVLDRSGFESGKENIVNHYYKDSDTYLLIDSVSVLTKMSREQVWETYGGFLIEYTMEVGWDELVRSMSPNLKGFLDNLDSLHYFIDHVVYKANLRGPSFRCEENQDGTITLHYYTGRPGLYPIVKGVIREVARRVFEIEVSLSITGRTQRSVQMTIGERIEEHVIFQIKLDNEMNADNFIAKKTPPVLESNENYLRMSSLDFATALPYHFIMDEECKLVFAGRELYNHLPRELLVVGTPMMRLFEITRPQIALDFDNICNFINAVFVLQARASPGESYHRQSNSESSADDTSHVQGLHLTLKGQMMMLSSNKHIIYLCSPYVTSIPELLQYGMRLTAMPLHDATRDIILLNQQRLSDVEVNLQLEANNEQLETMARDLEKEREKTDSLLKDLLPLSVAEQFLKNEDVEARQYEEASIMFSDVPNFAVIVTKCEPKQIVVMLNDLFTRFDRLIGFNEHVYKVETVGDCYVTVTGVPEFIPDHVEILCHTALGMLWESREVKNPFTEEPLLVRIGIHSGPIVAGVIGGDKPKYCMYGNSLSVASLMETHSLPGRIQLSAKAHRCASRGGRFEFIARGRIPIRGRGEMETYFLQRSYKKSIWEITKRQRDPAVHSIEGYEELMSVCQPGAIENKLSEMRTLLPIPQELSTTMLGSSSSIFPSSIPLFLPLEPSAFAVVQPSVMMQQRLHPTSPLPQQVLHYSWTTPVITVSGPHENPENCLELQQPVLPPALTPCDFTPMHNLTPSPELSRRGSSSSDSSCKIVRVQKKKTFKELDKSSNEFKEQRRIKNEAARRSRDSRRWNQQLIDQRVKALEEENARFHEEIRSIGVEMSRLRQLQLAAAHLLQPSASVAIPMKKE